MNFVGSGGRLESATGLSTVTAVAEAAVADEASEIGEAAFDLCRREVGEAELLAARRVGDRAPAFEAVEASAARRVPAGVEETRDLPRRRACACDARGDGRRFPHARLPDENGRPADEVITE